MNSKIIHALKITGIAFGSIFIFTAVYLLFFRGGNQQLQRTALILFVAGVALLLGAFSGRKLIELSTSKVVVTSAESQSRDWRALLKTMLRGMISSRYLAFRLFFRDLQSNYTQSRFGWIWDFLEPLVNSLVFIILRAGNVINIGEINIPYSVFIVIGFMLWSTFTESIILPLSIIRRTKQLITHVKIPPEAMILSNIFTIFFNSLFKIAVIVLVAVFQDAFNFMGFLKFLILYPGIILFGLSISIILAPFNVFYGDIERVIRIVLRPLMYITPIFYYDLDIEFISKFNEFNPIAIWVVNLRSIITTNVFLSLDNLVILLAVTGVIFLFGWFVFHISIPIISERV